MKLRSYNMIKNIMLGSCAATFYNLNLVADIPVVKEVVGTAAVFVAMVVLLRDADSAFIKARKEQRKAKRETEQENLENEKSA